MMHCISTACTTELPSSDEQLPTPEDSATGYQTAVFGPSLCKLLHGHAAITVHVLLMESHCFSS